MIDDINRRFQRQQQQPSRDYLKTDDINNKNTDSRRYTSMHLANRQMTNPLDPQYQYPGFKQMQEQLDQHQRAKSPAQSENSMYKMQQPNNEGRRVTFNDE